MDRNLSAKELYQRLAPYSPPEIEVNPDRLAQRMVDDAFSAANEDAFRFPAGVSARRKQTDRNA